MLNKVKVGIIGLGRMGQFHARSILHHIPNAQLEAVCVLDDEVGRSAVSSLQALTNDEFTVYHDFKEMCEKANIDCALIVSNTAMHPEHIKIAIENNLHVFTEKPIGSDVSSAKSLKEIVEKSQGKLIFRIGYMRRYDDSYTYVKKLINEGKIGKPFFIRSYTIDPISTIKGFLDFGPRSGGQFIDMSVHDINLIRWYLGTEPEEVYAIGDCYEYEDCKSWNDGDNVSCLMKMKPDGDGKQAMVFLVAGRMAAHGYTIETEIMGTKGTIRVGSVPQKNMVELLTNEGVVVECQQNMYERFGQAYINEVQEFIDSVSGKMHDPNYVDNPRVTIDDGINDLIVAYSCRESFENKKLLKITY